MTDMEENNVNTVAESVEDAVPVSNVSLEKEADRAFSKSLAAVIMANFPIASIIAIFFAAKSRGLVNALFAKAEALGVSAGGKGIAAKVLSIVGLALSIAMTVLYAIFSVIFFIYFLLIAFILAY